MPMNSTKIFLWLFTLLFALLAIPSHFRAYPVILTFLFLFMQKPRHFRWRYFLWNSLLYTGLVVTLMYSTNFSYGKTFVFETQVLLVVFPLLFSLLPDDFEKIMLDKKEHFFLTYIIIVFLYVLSPLTWFFAPYHYNWQKMLHHFPGILQSPDYGLFSIHPIYMAVATGWAFILSLYVQMKTGRKGLRIVLTGINLYFLLVLFLLAKMGALLALIIASLLFIYLYKRQIFYRLVPVIILGAGLLFIIPNTQKRIKEVLKIEHKEVLKKTSTGKHLRIFQTGLKVFKQAPVFGHGLGSHKDRLMQSYKQENQTDLLEQKLSTHNQYMSFLLIGGVFLLMIYLLMIIISFKTAWQTKNYLMLMFVVYFSIVMLFENYLEREDGVIVFALFFSYFNFLSFVREKQKQEMND